MKIEKLSLKEKFIQAKINNNNPEQLLGKLIANIENKLNELIKSNNEQEKKREYIMDLFAKTVTETAKQNKKIDFIMENSRFTEPPKFISKKTLKELYKKYN